MIEIALRDVIFLLANNNKLIKYPETEFRGIVFFIILLVFF